MTKYYALPLATKYWKPGEKYVDSILRAVEKRVADGDFVVISEKALSTALGNILDEGSVTAGFSAKLISGVWMRVAWGYFLSVLCRFGQRLTRRLRAYPLGEGSRHKQVALQRAGLLQALMWGSEGGIDGSNMPYSYVSLPLSDSHEVAEAIRRQILLKLRKKVFVIIVDTDKTYSFRNFHFTPHPKPLKGIHTLGGVAAYVVGRMFRFRKRPTPLATAGGGLQAMEALKIANIADRARGPGSGATVWDMAARFNVAATGISWDMLTQVKHKPVVLVRRKRRNRNHRTYRMQE
jgi:F420-0:gamma-glutamyl ligase-like protein